MTGDPPRPNGISTAAVHLVRAGRRLAFVLAMFLSIDLPAQKGGSHSSRSSSSHSSTSSKSKASHVKKSTVPKKSTVAPRNAKGRIKRSSSARAEFRRADGLPERTQGLRRRPHHLARVWRRSLEHAVGRFRKRGLKTEAEKM